MTDAGLEHLDGLKNHAELHLNGTAVTDQATAAPRGGMARMSRRVMNLAHLVKQNARRHGERVGFIWGERSWTWREIDSLVSALAAALLMTQIEISTTYN